MPDQFGVVHQETRIDDGHVETGGDGVVKEGRVHGFADGVVSTEGEGHIGESTAGACTGAALFTSRTASMKSTA